jgi:hypothetical protein
MTLEYEKTLVRCKEASFGFTYNGLALGITLTLDVEPAGGIGWTTPCLDTWSHGKDRRMGTAYGMDFLLQFFTFFGIDNLTKMVGKYWYVLAAEGDAGWGKSSSNWVGFERLGIDTGARLIFKDIADEWGVGNDA